MRSPDPKREPGSTVGAEVVLLIEEPVRRWIDGRLVDLSPNGFRASHGDPEIEVGRMVRFWIGNRSGEARVLWRRIVHDRVECGFVIGPGTVPPKAA